MWLPLDNDDKAVGIFTSTGSPHARSDGMVGDVCWHQDGEI